jgi:hypothetical protein
MSVATWLGVDGGVVMSRQIGTTLVAGLCVGIIVMVSAPYAGADDLGRIEITFNEPTEIPSYYGFDDNLGRQTLMYSVLPSGKYLFAIVDPTRLTVASGRVIIRVMSADGKRQIATLMALPTYPAKVHDAEFTFYEMGVGTRRALHEWIRADGKHGFAFVYPMEQAIEIARKSRDTVLAAEFAAYGPWVASAERMKGLLEQPLTLVGPDGMEMPPVTPES